MNFSMLVLIIAAILLTQETVSQFVYPYYGIGYGYGYYGYYPYYGLWGKRETVKSNPRANRTMCAFLKERTMLSCSGPTGIVECESVSSFEKFSPIQFESFGIEKAGSERFNLFPRKLDNTAFISNTCDKHEHTLSIFTDEKSTDVGIRVKETHCFSKIAELLESSTRSEMVNLEVDLKQEKSPKTANLIGDLILFESKLRMDIMDQQHSKP